MIHYEVFYHLVRRSHFDPQTIFFRLGSWKKKKQTKKEKYIYILGIHPQKDNHPGLFPQKGFCASLQIWEELIVAWHTKQKLFLSSQGPLTYAFMSQLKTWLANCCESYLVELPLLYLAFFKTILAALFRTFGLPLRFLLSKPSFLDDHFTTQHSDFSSFLAVL